MDREIDVKQKFQQLPDELRDIITLLFANVVIGDALDQKSAPKNLPPSFCEHRKDEGEFKWPEEIALPHLEAYRYARSELKDGKRHLGPVLFTMLAEAGFCMEGDDSRPGTYIFSKKSLEELEELTREEARGPYMERVLERARKVLK